MKVFRSKQMAGFTLVEIMIVVLIIGILLAIAIPNFVAARESSRAKACVGNLKQIDSAEQQYAMDNKMNSTSTFSGVTVDTLSGTSGYIRVAPACPEGGTYSLAHTVAGEPYCSISGITAANSGDNTAVTGTNNTTDYQTGGKFFHGLSN